MTVRSSSRARDFRSLFLRSASSPLRAPRFLDPGFANRAPDSTTQNTLHDGAAEECYKRSFENRVTKSNDKPHEGKRSPPKAKAPRRSRSSSAPPAQASAHDEAEETTHDDGDEAPHDADGDGAVVQAELVDDTEDDLADDDLDDEMPK